MINIKFNNETIPVRQNDSLLSILDERGFNQAYYAVALNRGFIPRTLYEKTILKDGDIIEVISPMQGG